ncbi:hypothetical protein, partial [Herminiimonas sp. CN]|uniref:hypothetical protein n=1 Tax=Herminiimonas sp. CN TaxID=1349818 RepID=UPI001EE65048
MNKVSSSKVIIIATKSKAAAGSPPCFSERNIHVSVFLYSQKMRANNNHKSAYSRYFMILQSPHQSLDLRPVAARN